MTGREVFRDNAVVTRELMLARPDRLVRWLLINLSAGIIAAALFGVWLARFPTRHYLDEAAYLLGAPMLFSCALGQYLVTMRLARSQMPLALASTTMSPQAIAAGFYAERFVHAGIPFVPSILFLPNYREAFTETLWWQKLAFMVSFVCVYDFVGRIFFLLSLRFSPTGYMAWAGAVGFAGILMLYGLGAVARGFLQTEGGGVLFFLAAIPFIACVNVATWRPYTEMAGDVYGDWIARRLQE